LTSTRRRRTSSSTSADGRPVGRFLAALVVVAVLTGCGITEPPGPETVTGALTESVDLTADRPVALIPVTVRFTPATVIASGFGRNEYALAEVTPAAGGTASGVAVTAIAEGDPQPRAWLLGGSIPLPEITPSELISTPPCNAQTCEHVYQLLITQDEATNQTLSVVVRAGSSYPAGTDTSKTKVEIKRTGEVRLFAAPPTVSDVVRGTLTIDDTAPLDRVVRLRYTGPAPNAWPLRAEAIVRAHRRDGERTPLAQLDLFDNVGLEKPRIFADYVGPELSVVANLFDGCAAGVLCERFLALHFYPASGGPKIDWEVELRVRDYESDLPVDATVSAEDVSAP
jgi:hypothetical protein